MTTAPPPPPSYDDLPTTQTGPMRRVLDDVHSIKATLRVLAAIGVMVGGTFVASVSAGYSSIVDMQSRLHLLEERHEAHASLPGHAATNVRVSVIEARLDAMKQLLEDVASELRQINRRENARDLENDRGRRR
jgi:hypothetical protein